MAAVMCRSRQCHPKSKAGEILNDLTETELKRILAQYPGLEYSFEGQDADMADSMSSLKISFVLAVLAIYALLAIPFQSYLMPLIVITTILLVLSAPFSGIY